MRISLNFSIICHLIIQFQIWNQKWIKFRNGITHKGTIPTPEQALEYAKAIGEYITEINKCLESKIEMWRGFYPRLQELMKKGQRSGSITLPTILSSLCRGEAFEQAIAAFDERYDLMYETNTKMVNG